MSGLDSIALAVAHLEERQKHSNPAILSRNSSDASASLASSEAVMPVRASPVSADVRSLASSPPPPPRALHVPPARVISVDEASLNPTSASTNAGSPSSPSSNNSNGSAFGYILADPVKWLQKTQDRPPLQPPSELAHKVEPSDVLCGRGGETNHHPGNVQYRLLVKAFQPLYVAAKRRDKPLIAQCIVYSVRQVGGRFLKRANDKEWKDVGNTKAREKTSQALREGAPELRGDAVPKMIPKQPMMMTSPPHSQPPQMPTIPQGHQGQPMSFVEARFLSALLAQQAALTRSVVTGQHHPQQQQPMSHPLAHHGATANILPQPHDYQHHQEYHFHQQQQLQQAQRQQQQLPPIQRKPQAPSPTTTTSQENSRKRPAVVSDGHSDSDSIGSNGSSNGSSKGGPRLKRFKMRFQQETKSID